MANGSDLLTARIVLRAVLPIVKVLLEDDPKTKKKFENVTATVQFVAHDTQAGALGAHLKFDNGAFEIVHDIGEKRELNFGLLIGYNLKDRVEGKVEL